MLKQTIDNSLQAIRTTDAAKKQKSSIDAYTKALTQLNKATDEMKATFSTARLLDDTEIVEKPVFTEEQKSEVLESIRQCMEAVKNSELTIETVKLLQARGQFLQNSVDLYGLYLDYTVIARVLHCFITIFRMVCNIFYYFHSRHVFTD